MRNDRDCEESIFDVVRLPVVLLGVAAYAAVGWCSGCAPRMAEHWAPPDAWASEGATTREMPPEPFPGQRRATKEGQCGVRQVAIRTSPKSKEAGCWKRLAEPPTRADGCGEDFEWRGACYAPVLQAKRAPTSVEP